MSSFIFPKVKHYCEELIQEFSHIPDARKRKLERLKDYISDCYNNNRIPSLIVICTHNSRRSHLGQTWLAVGADYFNLPPIATYSGGTEATAFNTRAVKALDDVGFEVVNDNKSPDNPHYKLYWTYTMAPYEAFSKKYDDPPNPTKEFGAIMVCTEADKGCPLIPGVDFRIALPFEDPKAFDGTAQEVAQYAGRCRQIGREMLYVMSGVSVVNDAGD